MLTITNQHHFPKTLRTLYDGEAAKGKAERRRDPDTPKYDGPFNRRLSDNRRPQQALHIYHLRKTAANEEVINALKQASGLEPDDDMYFHRLADPQFALVVFPDVLSARAAKKKLEHQFFHWTLRQELPQQGTGFHEHKAVTGLKMDFITKSKAVEIERLDEEAVSAAKGNDVNDARGSNCKDGAAACKDGPAAASASKDETKLGHFKIDAIKQALDLPNLGKDAARSMTAASSLFMEELLTRAANEAQREGSREVKPEHLKRVAPYVMLPFL
ncbi:hypothetical protein AAVH_21097 [Aphelenchoides avenae]|nr:hypothetical protein AAVH_21097 [Aphelenchus avenae]